MDPWALFKTIKEADFITVGDDLDYCVKNIDGRAYLIFEESDSDQDWRNNFKFARKLYKKQKSKMRVHRGFGDVWKSGNDTVMDHYIAEYKKTEEPPIIIGWSFGGAMAVLAGEDFYYRTGIKPLVITFGAPKVAGNRKTRDYLTSCGTFVQYANRNDIVPRCPPLPGYRQVNELKVGEPFAIKKIFNPEKYHANYDNPGIYWELVYDFGF